MIKSVLIFLVLAIATSSGLDIVVGETVPEGSCIHYGPYEKGMYMVDYVINITEFITTDVIFLYNSSSVDFETNPCPITSEDIVRSVSTMEITNRAAFSEPAAFFEREFWIVIRNDGNENITVAGLIVLEKSPIDTVIEEWVYFVIGFGALLLIGLSVLIGRPLIQKCRGTGKTYSLRKVRTTKK